MDKTLTSTLNIPDNYILLKFFGDLTTDKVEGFKADLAEASAILVDSYRTHSKKVHILLDMTNFSGNYSLDALNLLTDFAKKNTPFVARTASFGGSDKVKMAGEAVVALSGRDNIKIFDKQEEAVAWLNEA